MASSAPTGSGREREEDSSLYSWSRKWQNGTYLLLLEIKFKFFIFSFFTT